MAVMGTRRQDIRCLGLLQLLFLWENDRKSGPSQMGPHHPRSLTQHPCGPRVEGKVERNEACCLFVSIVYIEQKNNKHGRHIYNYVVKVTMK